MKFLLVLQFLLIPTILPAEPLAAQFSCDASFDYCACHPSMSPCVPANDPGQTKDECWLDSTAGSKPCPPTAMNLGATPDSEQYAEYSAKDAGDNKEVDNIGQVLSQAVPHPAAGTPDKAPDLGNIAKNLINAAPASYTNSPARPPNFGFYHFEPAKTELSAAKNMPKRESIQRDAGEIISAKADTFSGRSAEQKQKQADFSQQGERITPHP